jgi:hypothetical protein
VGASTDFIRESVRFLDRIRSNQGGGRRVTGMPVVYASASEDSRPSWRTDDYLRIYLILMWHAINAADDYISSLRAF